MQHLPSPFPRQNAPGVARSWRRLWALCLAASLLALLLPAYLGATDLPHTDGDNCTNCHMVHNALGGAYLNVVNGNANLCQSCHVAGGSASAKALANSAQAMPWPGLPAAYATGTGNSHRWDSGVAGHVASGATNTSTGTVTSSGTFTGPYAKTYTLTITTSGTVGAAQFNWTAATPGGGSGSGTNVLTGTSVALDQGISANFTDGTGTSFQTGDTWNIFVRTDLVTPTNAAMKTFLSNGQMMCSTCHNPHSQQDTPFDPTAPAYVSGSGAGRHFMIDNNNTDQLCVDCHAPRNVTTSGSGTHPIGLPIPANAYFKQPTLLPLTSSSNMVCETCHDVHFSADNDGALVRLTDRRAFCADCHTLADTSTPGAHFTGSSALWPGGQYGTVASGTTTFPAMTDATMKGTCETCHQPHGWPVAAATGTNYAKLLVDQDPTLCITCHDSNGPAVKNVQSDFANTRHHPVLPADQVAGRSVGCTDCHNPHKTRTGTHTYLTTGTSTRNQVSNVLKGADGVQVNFAFSGTANFQAIPAGAYTYIPASTGVTYEYQICFKCHTSYAFGATPPAGLSPIYTTGSATFTNNSATVTGTGTTWTTGSTAGTGMVGMWIAPASSPTAVYRITAVASSTSLTITPAYSGTTATRVTYVITGETDIGQEFSIYNKSGHPIFTGLNSYPNSPAPKPLTTSELKAPWNVNVGTQTMLCSDCHNSTDVSNPAAVQGPHGSAAQFMLSGSNAANWPNVTLTNFTTSFCANCHVGTQTVSKSGHVNNHNSYRCYQCHIVIPHGGKVSRLIATGTGTAMPSRYAYSGSLGTVNVLGFLKSNGTYSSGTSNCRTTCSQHQASTSGTKEIW